MPMILKLKGVPAGLARRAPYLRHVGDVSGGDAGEILLPGDAA